ncbi:hypothetical protein D3C81_1198890 [compost metagenome]
MQFSGIKPFHKPVYPFLVYIILSVIIIIFSLGIRLLPLQSINCIYEKLHNQQSFHMKNLKHVNNLCHFSCYSFSAYNGIAIYLLTVIKNMHKQINILFAGRDMYVRGTYRIYDRCGAIQFKQGVQAA